MKKDSKSPNLISFDQGKRVKLYLISLGGGWGLNQQLNMV
jgi:hypothetical protein